MSSWQYLIKSRNCPSSTADLQETCILYSLQLTKQKILTARAFGKCLVEAEEVK